MSRIDPMICFLKKTVRSFRDAVFPPRCLACRSFFVRSEHGIPDAAEPFGTGVDAIRQGLSPFLCDECLVGVRAVESPLCPRCGMMFRERVSDDHLCGTCLTEPGRLSMARAFGVYERSLMQVIRAFKYRGKVQLARPLGRLLFQAYQACYGTGQRQGPDLILPVPLHRRRFRQRGFNQAFLMLKEWPGRLDARQPDQAPRIVRDGLLRTRKTKPQAGLDKKSRKTNIKGAFALSSGCDVKGRHVLLVDDVYTTGATADECARVLVGGGAIRVDILTVARAL